MNWIEREATEAWAPEEQGAWAQAAVDFLTVCIKPIPIPAPSNLEVESPIQWAQTDQPSSSTAQSSGQTSGHGRRHGRYAGGPTDSPEDKALRKRQRTERQVEKRREEAG